MASSWFSHLDDPVQRSDDEELEDKHDVFLALTGIAGLVEKEAIQAGTNMRQNNRIILVASVIVGKNSGSVMKMAHQKDTVSNYW